MGTRWSTVDWLHVCIWAKDSEWEQLNYLAAGSESLSNWLVNKVLDFKGTPVKRKKIRGERGKVRPLCVDAKKWAVIKDRANIAGLKISQYVLACALPAEE